MVRMHDRERGAPGISRFLTAAALLIAAGFLLTAGCTGFGGGYATPVPGTPVPAAFVPTVIATTVPVPAPGQSSVTVDLVAKDMAFSRTVITVPAGAFVTVSFHNREDPGSSQVTGIAHNFAVYDSAAATTTIFSGEIITGGGDAVYRFTAPETPGTYYFRCDVHPAVMNGQFIVQ